MSRYPLGQPVRLSTTVKDVTGALANAGGLTLTVLKPDLTTQAYASPVNDGTGLYHQDVPAADLTQTGHHQFKWISTGSNSGVSSGAFEVYDPFDSELLSVQDAKDFLRKSQSITADDDQLELMIAAVTESIESVTGPVGRRTVTETVYPSSGVLLLGTTPVISLTSVTPYASTALSLAGLSTDITAGIVRPLYATPGLWASSYTVVYVAGRATVPASITLAAQEIIANAWNKLQRGPGSVGGSRIVGADITDAVQSEAFSYLQSYGVRELLAPFKRPPAIA